MLNIRNYTYNYVDIPYFCSEYPIFLIIAGSILGITLVRKEEKTGEREETNEISIGLSLIGGFFGILIGIVHEILSTFTIFTLLMIMIGTVPFIGAVIKLYRNLFIGSIICLITGIILLILIIVGMLSPKAYLDYFVAVLRVNFGDLARLIVTLVVIIPYLLIIIDGARGILEARKVKES